MAKKGTPVVATNGPTLYAIPAPAPDGDALLAEITAAGLPAPQEVRYLSGQVVLPYAQALGTDQANALSVVVAAHKNTPALEDTRLTARQRSDANLLLADAGGGNKLLRAVLLVLLDEVNALRQAAGLPQRTVAQARSAVASKISSGSADT